MSTHCEDASRMDASHGRGYGPFELPEKKAYGCPHCGKFTTTDFGALHKHICHHFNKGSAANTGQQSLRVRSLLHGDEVSKMMASECRRQDMPPDAWKSFAWDNADAEQFSGRLQYGWMNEDDPYRDLGYTDLETFIKTLVERRLRSNGGSSSGPATTSMRLSAKPIRMVQPNPSHIMTPISQHTHQAYDQGFPDHAVNAPTSQSFTHEPSFVPSLSHAMVDSTSAEPFFNADWPLRQLVGPTGIYYHHPLAYDIASQFDGTTRSQQSPFLPENLEGSLGTSTSLFPTQESDPDDFGIGNNSDMTGYDYHDFV